MKPPLHPSEREPYPDEFDQRQNFDQHHQRQNEERWSPGRQVAAALARFLTVFCVGVAATLAWQSYGNAARRMVAGLSPQLGWLAPQPPAAPDPPSASASPDQLAAISHSLTAVRQSVDRLAADITRLRTAKPDLTPARASTPPASAPPPAAAPTAAPGRKPAPGQQQALPGPMIAR